MAESTVSRRGVISVRSGSRRLTSAVLICLLCAPVSGADDAYLKMLDQEVTKVEPDSSDKAIDAKDMSAGTAANVPSREHFEEILREQNVGTYSFYRKLPERTREEIFLDYSNGASMEALRGKIIDRYLHP